MGAASLSESLGTRLATTATTSSMKPTRDLIVEDNRAINGVLARLLRDEGLHVATAGTLAEGIRLAAEGPELVVPDLILLDGQGSSLVRRTREYCARTRVVVISSLGDAEARDLLGDLTPEAYLAKPFHFQQLMRGFGSSEIDDSPAIFEP